ncbi:MAG TPA: hypothetical protein VK194_11465 [Candidatus Deferrimicrobium sp.]|nr:hypothetical protein [Candidatus Deferrimicrobium sp.]
MPDALERVLRLVAEGRLTAAEAAPILDALGTADRDDDGPRETPEPAAGPDDAAPAGGGRGTATAIRIEVTEGGRRVVNLRVPVSLGRMALDRIPGLSGSNIDLVRQALADGRFGTLLHIDEEGDGVRIALE